MSDPQRRCSKRRDAEDASTADGAALHELRNELRRFERAVVRIR